jgi:hypothetical protein
VTRYGGSTKATILARKMEAVEANDGVVVPSLSEVKLCSSCGRRIGKFVYSGSFRGIVRYRTLCSRCASKWIALGGAIALRSVRR